MKTNFSLIGAACLSVLALTIWSCKDNFTDEDLLNRQHEMGQDSIQLSVVVYNGSTSFKGASGGRQGSAQSLSNITVTITGPDGALRTVVTGDNGIATFNNINPGSVSGTVQGQNFTSANFIISLVNNTNLNQPVTGGNNRIQAGVLIPLYETTGPNTATVSGKATCDSDLLNDTRENVPDGTTVSFSVSTASIDFDNSEEVIGSILGILGQVTSGSFKNARIESISYETTFVATVAAGAYSITLPTSADGLTYDFSFSDFRVDQKIAINNFRNQRAGSLRNVVQIPTLFSQNSTLDADFATNNPIPLLNAIQVDIEAPPAAGSGAAATVKLLAGSLTSFTILNPGTGYPAVSSTIPITITGGDYDPTIPGATPASLTASSDSFGQIIGIGGTAGFGYRSQPTVTISGPGTGAVVRVNFSANVAPMDGFGTSAGTVLTSGGSGYFVPPTLEVRGYEFDGEYFEETATTQVFNGSVISFNVPVGTFARIISAVFIPQERINAFVSGTGSVGVSSSGGIIGTGVSGPVLIDLDVDGNGYNPIAPPNVTVRDLRAGGSGAVVFANTDATGILDFLSIQMMGSGYSPSLNANFPTSPMPFAYSTLNESNATDNVKTQITVRPGLKRILDAYFGTGAKEREVE